MEKRKTKTSVFFRDIKNFPHYLNSGDEFKISMHTTLGGNYDVKISHHLCAVDPKTRQDLLDSSVQMSLSPPIPLNIPSGKMKLKPNTRRFRAECGYTVDTGDIFAIDTPGNGKHYVDARNATGTYRSRFLVTKMDLQTLLAHSEPYVKRSFYYIVDSFDVEDFVEIIEDEIPNAQWEGNKPTRPVNTVFLFEDSRIKTIPEGLFRCTDREETVSIEDFVERIIEALAPPEETKEEEDQEKEPVDDGNNCTCGICGSRGYTGFKEAFICCGGTWQPETTR